MLVRHGAVAMTDPPRYWGHSDIPLSAEGVSQTRKLRARLAGEDIAAIYSSDLRRAVDTAAAIAEPHRMPVTLCPELREIDFGRCEGLTFDEIAGRYPEAKEVWTGLDSGLSFPGGESIGSLAARVDRFIARLSGHWPTQTVLAVAHGGSLRVLVCRLLGTDLSRWWQTRLDIASVTVLEPRAEGMSIALLNDVSHLASPDSEVEDNGAGYGLGGRI